MGNEPHSQMVGVAGYKRRKCLAAFPVRLVRSMKKGWMGMSAERVAGRRVVVEGMVGMVVAVVAMVGTGSLCSLCRLEPTGGAGLT